MVQEIKSANIQKKVSGLIRTGDVHGLSNIVDGLPVREIIHLIGHLNKKDQKQFFTLLSPDEAAEVMEEIPEAQAISIIGNMESTEAAAIISAMESDDQADIIMELDDDDARAILDEMIPGEADAIRRLMTYEYDTAGGMMHTEYMAFPETITVSDVIHDLRANADEYKDYYLKYIFVTTSNGTLKGVLQMQDLLLSSPEIRLSDITITNVLSLDHLTPLDELIDFFQSNEFFGAPVVDDAGILIGVVLRRDVLEAQTERITIEHLESQGIIGGDELRTMPVTLRARRRLSWLSVNILLNIIAASVIALHQDTLSSVIALAVFLPIISDMSGCSGNQAVAVSMRELSIGVVEPREVWRVLWQELKVGLLNGLVLGILIGLAALLWKGNIWLGFVVGGALAINTLLAVCLGGTVPLILKGFKVDPALASGPILTTITDMVGFFLTLTFAAMALSQLSGIS